ncbi:hypothetical protein TNCV_3812851 [Trichonephila clavipes]|nr:hypothetical protein TNCV_3812851 [Trichonephila clavipes]
MRMTSDHGSDNSLRWRAVVRLEGGQSQTVTSGPKVVESIPNTHNTSGTITRKISQGYKRSLTSAQDRYLALKARRQMVGNGSSVCL